MQTDRRLVQHVADASQPGADLRREAKHPYTRLLLSAVPDPRSSIESPLEGGSGVPPVIDPPPGCPFADRCPQAQDSCRKSMPQLDEQRPGHYVRCPVVA